jgi:uncharacterized integral membrane protein
MKNILVHHKWRLIISVLFLLLILTLFLILNKAETKIPERALFVNSDSLSLTVEIL